MLPAEVVELMRNLGVFPVVLGTSDREGNIHLAFITWVYPISDRVLRFALSSNAKSSKNVQETGRVSIILFAPGKALSCYGSAKVVLDRIEEVKFPVSVFEMEIERVEDNLFPGATITGIIPFAHTGNLEKVSELDMLVIEAMKKA